MFIYFRIFRPVSFRYILKTSQLLLGPLGLGPDAWGHRGQATEAGGPAAHGSSPDAAWLCLTSITSMKSGIIGIWIDLNETPPHVMMKHTWPLVIGCLNDDDDDDDDGADADDVIMIRSSDNWFLLGRCCMRHMPRHPRIKQRCTHPSADLNPGLAAVAAHQHRRASEQSSQGTCTSQPIHLGLERWRSCGKRELHIGQSWIVILYMDHTHTYI